MVVKHQVELDNASLTVDELAEIVGLPVDLIESSHCCGPHYEIFGIRDLSTGLFVQVVDPYKEADVLYAFSFPFGLQLDKELDEVSIVTEIVAGLLEVRIYTFSKLTYTLRLATRESERKYAELKQKAGA